MAHVMGVPKRDPCQKCQLPVFLAERLFIGKQVYHRTCLKCARCGSQLTPGSFYETEVSNEFCCETCPDEEDQFAKTDAAPDIVTLRSPANTSKPSSGVSRNSLSERLAFFEKNAAGQSEHKLLSKNVSDEEKRQHISELDENVYAANANKSAPSVAYKGRIEMSNFLLSTVDDELVPAETETDSAQTSNQVVNEANESHPMQTTASERFTTKMELCLTQVNEVKEEENQAKAELVEEPSSATEKDLKIDTAATKSLSVSPTQNTKHSESPTELVESFVSSTVETKSLESSTNEDEVPMAETESSASPMEEAVQSEHSASLEDISERELDTEPLAASKDLPAYDAQIESNDIIKQNDSNLEVADKEKPKKDIECNEVPAADKDKPNKDTESNEVPPKVETNKNDDLIASDTELKDKIVPIITAADDHKMELPAEEASSPKAAAAVQQKDDYPEDLNPFASDESQDEDDAATRQQMSHDVSNNSLKLVAQPQSPSTSLNPFDSSDDEVELNKQEMRSPTGSSGKVPPPRPPPPRITRNPFGEDEKEEEEHEFGSMQFDRNSSLTQSLVKKIPLPTPRTSLSQSQTTTPEPTPRLSQRSAFKDGSYRYDSSNSLSTPGQSELLHRDSDGRGSNSSLSSSANSTIRSRKSRRAPVPPVALKELFPSSEDNIKTSNTSINSAGKSNTNSTNSPKIGLKKRQAPAPPKPARLELGYEKDPTTDSKNLYSYPLQSDLDLSKLSDEEKALLEGKPILGRENSRRIIPLDERLLSDDEVGKAGFTNCADDQKRRASNEETDVVYRRVLMPPKLDTPTHDGHPLLEMSEQQFNMMHNRQLEKLKDNKEAQNRTRQSQAIHYDGNGVGSAAFFDKSTQGKWKRRKGPAPALPIPPRKVLQMLPLQEIRHELEIIEVQQQGLEKQGVILEKMIRDRCEGGPIATETNTAPNSALATTTDAAMSAPAIPPTVQNSKEVEDLILQLFELVNEKNELFRRQAELMYLRRQHRLEQEQADIEYEIRVLMGQPEHNKTDTDKAREETLIARLVEVVGLRNEVIESLEMDRLREAEEDLSIKQRLEIHNAKRDAAEAQGKTKLTNAKLSKKEKKQQKEIKKLFKSKKLDVDKDADESEVKVPQEKKKSRKFFL